MSTEPTDEGRASWRFTYTAEAVAAAATARAVHHRSREAFWADEAERLEAEIREDGVQFRERPVTGGNQMDVVVDQQRASALSEARRKRDGHAARAVEFEAYVGALLTVPNRAMSLTIGDVDYFGMHRPAGE